MYIPLRRNRKVKDEMVLKIFVTFERRNSKVNDEMVLKIFINTFA